jgi:hypothetical protein
MADLKEWMTRRVAHDQELYDRYGKPLEASHKGEYVAIGPEGRTILGKTDVEVLEQAIKAFGSGNFALKRIGHRTVGQWLNSA